MPQVKITYHHPDIPSSTGSVTLSPDAMTDPEAVWGYLRPLAGCRIDTVQFVLTEREQKNRWKMAVAGGETVLGFVEWRAHNG